MDSFIIDTNVLVVANGKYPKADAKNILDCQRFLYNVREKHISVDSLELIFREYISHANLSGQPGMGDEFLKWFFYNQYNTAVCEQVKITRNREREFLEFPADESLKDFDRSDRKFAAVAAASEFDAVICNASDSDWWHFRNAFEKVGIKIKFLCPELMKEV